KIWPGQKIIYGDLANRLKMSKTPIGYALGKLEQENFLTLIPNQGYFVKEIDPEEIREYFEVREALESQAIFLLINKNSGKGLEELEQRIREHKEYAISLYDRKKMILDAKVHLQIAAMAGNRVLMKQLKQIFEHLYLRFRVEFLHPERMKVSPLEHENLLEAIKENDLEKGEAQIRIHIRSAMENMIGSMKREEEDFEFGKAGI
ncbi:MAG: GntR family transcriptional regulator, partial [Deltaproteobacteria bacterium]|nr:GntR family transcriptional regulator [Deltaproteobacteria bacterium]